MRVPGPVLSGAEAALERLRGRPASLKEAGAVGGGCINPAARMESDEGEAFFLKWNDSAHPEMFAAEADGLRALSAPGTLRVPEVVGWGGGCTREDPGWLMLEFVPRGNGGPGYGRQLGEGLARLHSSGAGASYGWHRDNFIGSLPQHNLQAGGWADFWRDARIEPQVRMARDRGHFGGEGGRELGRLLSRMDQALPPGECLGPALIHGDLWSGNYFPDSEGAPVLIDPAAYRGEGEVDLAMMELFGSLPAGFLEGYEEVRPLSGQYHRFRRELYQLYYLLVHVNLFGGSYVGGSLAAARRVLAAF